jgi:small subunit ribosomal protein S7
MLVCPYSRRAFFSLVVTRLLREGKAFQAERLTATALRRLQARSSLSLEVMVLRALVRISPLAEVRSVRQGGGVFRVPFPLTQKKQISLGLSWLLQAARKGQGSLLQGLTRELSAAARGRGLAVRRRQAQHRLAKSNRAFTHFRWH